MYPPVSPILVHFGPFSVRWYGVIMTTAIFLGTLVASRYVARKKQDPNIVWEMLFVVLVPALLGARLYFVFIQSSRGSTGLPYYLSHPLEILAIWHGGIHIYGALIFGVITVLLFLRYRKLPFLMYFDAIGLGLLLGQAIGRLGNFINQELYGPPTTLPWGLRIDPQFRIAPYNNLVLYPTSVRFHPLFLYELIWDLIGFALLFYISRRVSKRLRDGDLLLLYLIWFPLGRFWIEFLRTDSWFFPGTPFDLVHMLSAITILTAAMLLILRHRAKPVALAPSDAVSSGRCA
jgi:phosphatidylglycerol---prolipoprotein diacylglyceryl transferase